jgi:hypothetical protein
VVFSLTAVTRRAIFPADHDMAVSIWRLLCARSDASFSARAASAPDVRGGTSERSELPQRASGACAPGVIIVAIGSLMAGLLMTALAWPVFQAGFGPVDDHETLNWLGRDGQFRWSEIWPTLRDRTEVGDMGTYGRFRPAYYLGRLTQTVLFGEHATAWYISVMTAFAITCGLLGYAIGVWLARAIQPHAAWSTRTMVAVSTTAALAFGTMRAWSGIVTRLGPSEQLGLLAVACVVVASTKLALSEDRAWWWLFTCGLWIAVFSKETLVTFAILGPILAVYRYATYQRHRTELAAGFGALVPAALLGALLAPATLGSSEDIYGRGVDAARVDRVLDSLSSGGLQPWRVSSTMLLLISVVAARSVLTKRSDRLLLFALTAWSISAVVVDSWLNFGAYAGNLRNRAVIDLIVMLQTLAVVALGAAIASQRRTDAAARASLATAAGTLLALGGFGQLVLATPSNLSMTTQQAEQNAYTLRTYQTGIDDALQLIERHPGAQVVGVVAGSLSYEQANSVLIELWRRSDTERAQFLLIDDPTEGNDRLVTSLRQLSDSGSAEWHIRPNHELERDRPMVCVLVNLTASSLCPTSAAAIHLDVRGIR